VEPTLNDEVRWRRAFARELIAGLPPLPGLRAAVIGGSAARGYSDAYSDLELLLFWESEPDRASRRAIMEAWRADHRLPLGDIGHDSALLVRGVPVDLWQRTVAEEEEALDRVLRDHSRDLGANAELDTIRTALPLRGEELVRHWQGCAAAYPEALALGFLREQLPQFHLRHLGFAAVRENPTAFYHTLTDLHCTLFLVLLALNSSYFPTFKWLYRRLDELPVKPMGTVPRLRRMFQEDPPTAAEQMHALILETLDLVEARCPQFDADVLAWARHGVAQGEATRVVQP